MSLIFPTDLGSNAQSSNFMGFQAYTLTGGVGSGKSDRSYDISGMPIFLPIPVEGVQDQYANNWGSDTVNMAKMALGGAVAGVGAGVTGSAGLLDSLKSKMLKNVGGNIEGTPLANPMAAIASAFDAGNISTQHVKDMAMGIVKGASPLGVGMAVGTLGNAVVQSTGIAGFEETSVAYTGPQFRSFSFNFSLKPLTRDEQITIESIVNYFKLAAAPQELSGALYRIYSLPKVFGIKFYHRDGENHSLPKIGKCALTNIGLKYGGDRFQTFATGHAPIQTDISLQFIELVLQTQNTLQSGLGAEMGAGSMVDDFGAANNNVGGERAKAAAAAAAAAADANASANVDSFGSYGETSRATAAHGVDSFGGATGFGGGAGAAGTGAVDTFSSGSALGAIKSKARGGASFIPDGGSG